METIPEVEAEAEAAFAPDPPFPPLFFVDSPNNDGIYTRSFKLHPTARPSDLKPVPHPFESVAAQGSVASQAPSPPRAIPLFYFPASEPLPDHFRIPWQGRPPGIYVSLSHQPSLVNMQCSPPRPTSNRATQKALRTPELLENIFLRLDMPTLLVSIQRVNKAWKQVVDGSLALQRKLYFKPDPNARRGRHPQWKWTKDSREIFPVLNTLLLRRFGSCFFNFGGVYGWLRRAESFYEHRWTPNHHRLKKVETLFGRHMVYKSMGPEEPTPLEKLQAVKDRERFTRAGASWRRMLVSQPPIPDFCAMMFEPLHHDPRPQKMETSTIGSDDPEGGLRMGQLYDFVQDRACNHPLDSLWFRVTWFEPHGPFTSDLCEETADKMFARTDCVVEMFNKNDHFPGYHPPDPPNAKEFDQVFKCDDFKPHKWDADGVEMDYDSPGYNSASPLVDRDKCMIWCGFACRSS
ncbi:f-box domain-containing [Trichoderma cornu-damae]|uniref:F-box domain-containing n=1 Tax=Trichoderma cornu-damae TaxID=654480 RepID=A0A9P8TWE1_9HYPO|nr:f-box domain-containing [Trichoderma cornu-damae]